MFAARYFAPRYFAPRYWPSVGAEPTENDVPGVEITIGLGRAHYTVPVGRGHVTIAKGRAHFTTRND